MMSRVRPSCIKSAIALLGLCIAAGAAQAADPAYPTRPVRMVVSFAPGGGVDASARIVAPKLSDSMGQFWVVDNRAGAAGNIASDIVARANPDGQTVLVALDTQLTANPRLYQLPFDVEKDLKPVVILAVSDQAIVVNPKVPANTLKDFIALAKQKPGALRHGSAGVGSSNHLAAELFKKVAGVNILHVPYKGAGPAASAVLSGEIQMNVSSVASLIGFVKSGRLRALATTGLKRNKALPDVPTVAESGYPGFEAVQWYALVVPGKTPKYIVKRIYEDTVKALKSADVQATMDRLGMQEDLSTPEQLRVRIKKEAATWSAIIKEAGIRLQ
jgi:tripartite-type tricarboxylate transporter receptor subunit TctC